MPKKDRISTSSDELVDTSDETIILPFEGLSVVDNGLIVDANFQEEPEEPFHVEQRRDDNRRMRESERRPTESPQPTSSAAMHHHRCDKFYERTQKDSTPEQKAYDAIKNAELTKERLLPKNGKNYFNSSAVIDKTYFVVGSNLDLQTMEHIQQVDYIDFGKLIPKDRILIEDQRLEMVIRKGRTFYVPVSDTASINSFQRWEQAFRVYENLYTKKHSERSSELIEYNQIIHTESLNFIWDNVYLYDKDFRLHMARNPERNWGVIPQQAWSLRMRDRLSTSFPSQGQFVWSFTW